MTDIVKQEGFSKSQIELITNTVARGATPDELKLFLYTAQRVNLDPLTKQIHFVKRGGQMTIQTGIDGYRVIADRSGTLAGIDDAVFDTESEDHPNKASVTVYRIVNGERVSFTASARWAEYAPQGNQAFMWTKMPYLMLGKCAEALALRKAFPNDLSGIYTNEEMEQANPVEKPIQAEVTVEEVENLMKPDVVIKTPYIPAKNYTSQETSGIKKQCPFCEVWHEGKFPKCLDCWKREKNGEVLIPKRTLINEDAPPFN